MKLPEFFTKKGASETAEDVAARLAKAEQAHSSAKERLAAAHATYAADRTEAAREAHREAKQACSDVEDMLSIVRDEHKAAVAQEAAAERARLEAKLAAYDEELTPAAVLEAGREEAVLEASLILQLAKCRERRRSLRDRLKSKEGERLAVALKLGQPVSRRDFNATTPADYAISPQPVIDTIAAAAVPGTLLARLLDGLKPRPDSYLPVDNHHVRGL
jgi:hypothetical protein